MQKGILSFIFLILCLSITQAQSSNEERAMAFYQLNSSLEFSGGSSEIDTSFTYRNLTIVNFRSPKGFVILRSAPGGEEVIGYSYSNHFIFDADTTGVIESWADMLAESLHVPGYSPAEAIPKFKSGKIAVEPLCQTAWNQGWPYNYYCPRDQEEDRRTLVGCVAVALGQIIRYYDKWNDFQIQYSYEHEKYGSLTCFAGNYNWTGMENHPLGINNDVARLLSHSGILVDMDYGVGSSGAQSAKAASVMNLIYSGGHLNSDPYGNEDKFYSSISEYKPIYSTYEGHAFVCDGFDGNNYYHFNLGWGGSANGFYPLGSVTGKPLLSAVFDTSPVDSLKTPRNFMKNIISDTEVEISWYGPEGDRSKLTGYTIYLDDQFFAETSDTLYLHECVPGSHYLRVSANYTTGESRWIGPGSYFSHGSSNAIADEKLRIAINTSAGVPSSQRLTHEPTLGELNDIVYLNVTNAENLSGLENCINLRQLVLNSSTSDKSLDLSPLTDCDRLSLLRISKYQIADRSVFASLTSLQELNLSENNLTDFTFTSPLSNLYKLTISGNQIDNVSFLNDLDKLTYINLTNCGIAHFEALENTFGIEYLYLSDNSIADISLLNGNRTLRILDASNNQINGLVELEGLLMLRDLNLSGNQITRLNITDGLDLRVLNISNNLFTDIENLIKDIKVLEEFDASENQITSIPAVGSKIVKLDLAGNRIHDLVPLDNYGSVLDLGLRGNRITDLSPLMYRNFAGRLSKLNLRDNPISKESHQVYKPQISEAAGSVYFPATYNRASPCYLKPTADSVMMSTSVELMWEGDYDDDGYRYDLFISQDEGEFNKIAEGLEAKKWVADLDGSGNFLWYVSAYLSEDTLYSGFAKFKVFSGFSLPFYEDFEIYTPNVNLCAQSPYWRIYGEDQSVTRDAYVTDIRSFEGDNSIKIAGSTDLFFPLTEYLTGFCETEFTFMVDRNRQATIKTVLGDGSSLDIYFYAAGVCEVYYDNVRQKFFTYEARQWMEMQIISDEERGLKWKLDNQELFSIDEPQAIEGIRFCTHDGPGYYESAPTVMYLDNFSIKNGTLLGVSDIVAGNDYPGRIYIKDGSLIIDRAPNNISKVELFNLKGQLIELTINRDFGSEEIRMPLSSGETFLIARIYFDNNTVYSTKLVNW